MFSAKINRPEGSEREHPPLEAAECASDRGNNLDRPTPRLPAPFHPARPSRASMVPSFFHGLSRAIDERALSFSFLSCLFLSLFLFLLLLSRRRDLPRSLRSGGRSPFTSIRLDTSTHC